jgi:hypothetical protein
MRCLLAAVTQIPPGAPPGRHWLERLAGVLPAPTATRWLLLADLCVLVLIGARRRHAAVGAVLALGAGFLFLNVLGLVLTDFFLGLAVFHVVIGVAGVLAAGPARWAGAVLLALTLALGGLT